MCISGVYLAITMPQSMGLKTRSKFNDMLMLRFREPVSKYTRLNWKCIANLIEPKQRKIAVGGALNEVKKQKN